MAEHEVDCERLAKLNEVLVVENTNLKAQLEHEKLLRTRETAGYRRMCQTFEDQKKVQLAFIKLLIDDNGL